LQDIFK